MLNTHNVTTQRPISSATPNDHTTAAQHSSNNPNVAVLKNIPNYLKDEGNKLELWTVKKEIIENRKITTLTNTDEDEIKIFKKESYDATLFLDKTNRKSIVLGVGSYGEVKAAKLITKGGKKSYVAVKKIAYKNKHYTTEPEKESSYSLL